jgi:anti-sigma factor RsiW
MDCDRALTLLEKLVDSEASPAETREVESHLRGCPSCRGELRFLEAVARHSRTSELPEPPESYWEHLPRKIGRRIESERRGPTRGLLGRILSPGVVRLGALAASAVLLVVVGVNVLRDDALHVAPASAPETSPLAEAVPKVTADDEPAAPPAASPPPPAPRQQQELSAKETEALRSLGYVAGAEEAPAEAKSAPAEPQAAAAARRRSETAEEEGLESGSGLADTANVPHLKRADERETQEQISQFGIRNEAAPAAAGRPGAARARSVAVADCERWRRMLADGPGEGRTAADVRYELAACTIRALEVDASAERREAAIADGEAFLALEAEGERAEEIRAALARLREEP